MVAIVALLLVTLSTFHLTPVSLSVHLPDSLKTSGLKLPDLKNYFSGPVLQGFIFFDVVLVLFLLDTWLRRRNVAKQDIN